MLCITHLYTMLCLTNDYTFESSVLRIVTASLSSWFSYNNKSVDIEI